MEIFPRRQKVMASGGGWSDWVSFETRGAASSYRVRLKQSAPGAKTLGQIKYFEATGFHTTRQFEDEIVVRAAARWGGLEVAVQTAAGGGGGRSGAAKSKGGVEVEIEVLP